MAKEYKLKYLTKDFFNDYPSALYPEIEQKDNRPYIVILIEIEDNYFALPLRTNVKHNNCYKFKNSSRATISSTGVDYSKAVIVNDEKYIGSEAKIDKKEYIEIENNINTIIKRFEKYVKNYYTFIKYPENERLAKQYRYSTLQYFHDKLGIDLN